MADEQAEEIRVQVPLSKEAIERIDDLAARMQVARGRMVSMLIDAALDDNEWVIRFVTSSYMEPVIATVRAWKSQSGGNKPKHA